VSGAARWQRQLLGRVDALALAARSFSGPGRWAAAAGGWRPVPGTAGRPLQEEMDDFRRLTMDAAAAKPRLVRGERAAPSCNDCTCSPLALLIVLL